MGIFSEALAPGQVAGKVKGLAAVMLADGRWYHTEDPTLPEGPNGHLSFLQNAGEASLVMVQVPVTDIKAASYYHQAQPSPPDYTMVSRTSLNSVFSTVPGPADYTSPEG